MLDYLYTLSDVGLFVVLSIMFIAPSVIGIYIVKYFIPLELRYRDNPVIGNVSALISIIYGVLAGLMALYLINNIGYTSDAVQREANAVANLYRDNKWLKDPAQSTIKLEIKKYLEKVITVDWPLMKNGNDINHDGDQIIENIANELVKYRTPNNSESLLLHDMLDEIKTLYNAREQRIHMSFQQLNAEIWVVILMGTILTIVINYLFGMNFYLHVISVIAVALMAASMIFLLVTLDRPFQGEFAIEPDAFKSLLTYIEHDASIHKRH